MTTCVADEIVMVDILLCHIRLDRSSYNINRRLIHMLPWLLWHPRTSSSLLGVKDRAKLARASAAFSIQ